MLSTNLLDIRPLLSPGVPDVLLPGFLVSGAVVLIAQVKVLLGMYPYNENCT